MYKWNDHFGKNVPIAIFLIPLVCGVLLLGKEATIAKNDVKTLIEIEPEEIDVSHVEDAYSKFVINNANGKKYLTSGDTKHKFKDNKAKKELKLPRFIYGSENATNKIMLYLSPTCSSCANVFLDNIKWLCDIVDNSNGNVSLEVLGNVNSLADKDVTKEMYKINFSAETVKDLMSGADVNIAQSGVLRSFKLLCSVFKNQKIWKESKSPKNVLRQIIKYNDKYIKSELFSVNGIVSITNENINEDNIVSKNDVQSRFDTSLDNGLLKKYMVDYKEFSRNENLPKIHILITDKNKLVKFTGNLSQQNIQDFIKKNIQK